MYLYFFMVLFSLMPAPGQSKQTFSEIRFNDDATTHHIGERLSSLTKSTYHDVSERIKELNDIRFLYEKTPHYELGYVFCEIMERYRKMTMHYKRVRSTTIMSVYDAFTHVEHMQKLYFEIYHLQMMMHEIPRKYQQIPEFKSSKGNDVVNDSKAAERLAFEKAEAARLAKTQLLLKAIQKQAASGAKNKSPASGAAGDILGMENKMRYIGTNPAEYKNLFKKRWPLDYGWDPPTFQFR